MLFAMCHAHIVIFSCSKANVGEGVVLEVASLPSPTTRQLRIGVGVSLQASFQEGFVNESDPSVLRFLLASRQEVDSTQLRDDLLSMLVAGHETTASVLTWTLHLLVQHPEKLAKAR